MGIVGRVFGIDIVHPILNLRRVRHRRRPHLAELAVRQQRLVSFFEQSERVAFLVPFNRHGACALTLERRC
jgi:hypothetical protein